MPKDCRFCEYEISPDALALCQLRTNEGQNFKLMDIREEKDVFFLDFTLVLDVIEHLEDYFSARPLVAAEIPGGVPGAEVRTTDKPNRRRWRMKRWFQAKILPEWA